MTKFIIWIVIVFAILFVLRLVSVAKARRRQEGSAAAPRENTITGNMVRCVECGVYLPKADARPLPRGFGCGDPQCVHRGGAAR
jgi:hypothetical protein